MEDTSWLESDDVQLDRYNCDLNMQVTSPPLCEIIDYILKETNLFIQTYK